MEAVVYHGPGDIRVEAVPRPDPRDDELLVKVDACAVCGSDLKAYQHGNPRLHPPAIMGHEFTGVVVQAGPAAGDFGVGERIVMATSISCGECTYCLRGWSNLCVSLKPMGFSFDGGMAEYVIIPGLALRNGHVVRVPESIRPERAALAEPMSCAFNCLENCAVQEGDTVAILGAGPLGLMNLYIARKLGATRTIVSEASESRREIARKFGCDVVVDPASEDVEKVIMTETRGIGADVVIVAAPAAAPQEQALNLARKRGTVCLFASLPADRSLLSIDSRRIHYGELRVIGASDSTPRQVRKALEFIQAEDFPAELLVSHILPLREVFQAFELMIRCEALRVVLQPGLV